MSFFGGMGQSAIKNLGNGGTMDGDVTVTGDLTVNGGIALTLSEVLQGTSTIDVNSTEALLVRKNGDGGDIFIVDTTNSRVGVGVAPTHNLTVNNQIGIKRDGTDAYGTLTFDSSGFVIDQSASGYAPLKIKSNGTEVARFTSTGLGIGITSPEASLDVNTIISGSSGTNYGLIVRGSEVSGTNLDTGDGIGLKFEIPIDTATSNIGASIEAIKSSNLDSNSETKMILKTSGNDETLDTAFTIFSNQNTAIEATKGFYLDGGGNTFISEVSADTIQFTTGGSERLRIDSSGNIGIGVTVPVNTLHVRTSEVSSAGTDAGDTAIFEDSLDARINLITGTAKRNGIFFSDTTRGVGRIDYNHDTDIMEFRAGGTDIMYAKSTGLGIGTATPSRKIHIDQDVATQGGLYVYSNVVHTGTTTNALVGIYSDNASSNGDTLYVRNDGTGNLLTLNNDGTDRFVVKDGGNVGIGTATPSSFDSEANNLVVGDGSGDNGITIFTGSSAGHHGSIFFGDATGTPKQGQIRYEQNNEVMSFHTNTTERMRIDLNGNVGIGTSSPDGKLHVFSGSAGSVTAHSENDDLIVESSGNAGMTLIGPDANDIGIGWGSASLNRAVLGKWNYNANSFRLRTNRAGALMVLGGGESLSTLNLDASGNVGIGTSSSSSYDASGNNLVIYEAGNAGLTIATGTGNTGNIHFADGTSGNESYRGIIQYNHSEDALKLATSGNNRLVLDDNSRISLSNNDSGTQNTVFGHSAGANIDAGSNYNVFIGHNVAGGSLDDAIENTGVGYSALANLTSGDKNTAIGRGAGLNITTASNNTIIGRLAGDALNTGSTNVLVGDSALGTATTATETVAIGGDAMSLVASGQAVTGVVAIGQNALKGGSSTTTGVNGSIAIGKDSLKVLTTGERNTAIGYGSLDAEDAGSNNTAVGYEALTAQNNDTGANTAVGMRAGLTVSTGHSNTFIGSGTGATIAGGTHNTYIGRDADGANDRINSTAVGYGTTAQANNSVTLGNASVTDVYMGQSSQANINAGQLTISDTAVDSAANYIGLSNIHTKTAGSSDTSDSFTGLKSYLTFNDADAAFGNMFGADIQAINTTNATGGNSDNIFGLSSRARQDAGNSNNVFGGAFYADLNDGNLDQSAYGLYVNVDVEAPCEVAGDVFGIYVNVDDDDASAGECYGIRVNCASNVDAGIDLVGGGIKFPATQASSANANVLDDYEEGVFDVTVTTGSGSLTVNSSVNNCAYTKIGRVVHVQGLISFSAISSPSGDVYLDGLPFVNASGLGEGAPYQAGSVYMTGANTAVNNLVCFVDEATNYLFIREGGTTGTGNDVANHIDTGTSIFFQITYQIPA